MAIVRSIEDLARVLAELDVPHYVSAATRELTLNSNIGLPGGVVIRWGTKAPFVSIQHAVIEEIPKERMLDVEHALVRVNHQLDVLGFGLDTLRHVLYYRTTTPAYGGVESGLIDRLAKGVMANAKELLASFQAVVAGKSGTAIHDLYRQFAHAREVQFIFADAF
jgi:hypothetical protein